MTPELCGMFYHDVQALLFEKTGEVVEAVRCYQSALTMITHSQASVYNNLGVAFGKLNRLADSERAFAWALTIDARNAQYAQNLEVARQRLKVQPHEGTATSQQHVFLT